MYRVYARFRRLKINHRAQGSYAFILENGAVAENKCKIKNTIVKIMLLKPTRVIFFKGLHIHLLDMFVHANFQLFSELKIF
jgi:hypothetical protein